MYCNSCGAPNPDDASFCSTCGKPVVRPAAKAPVAAPPVIAAEPPKPAPPVAPGATDDRVRLLSGHSNPIFTLAFSPDGKLIASGSLDHSAIIWDAVAGRELHRIPGKMTFVSADFSPDGRSLALAATNGAPIDSAEPATNALSLCNPAKPNEFRALTGHDGQMFCVRFSPDGRLLASGGSSVQLWDLLSGRIIKSLKLGWLRSKVAGVGPSLAFSPDGQMIATTIGQVSLWDGATGKEIRKLSAEAVSNYRTMFVGFTPDSRTLVEARGNGTIRLWDASSGREVACLTDPPKRPGVVETLPCAALSKDGTLLAVSSYSSADDPSNKVTLWNLNTARPVATLKNSDTCRALAFSPDGQWLAVADTVYGGGKAAGQIKLLSMSEIL